MDLMADYDNKNVVELQCDDYDDYDDGTLEDLGMRNCNFC